MKVVNVDGYDLDALLDDLRWYGQYLLDSGAVQENYKNVIRKCEALIEKAIQAQPYDSSAR